MTPPIIDPNTLTEEQRKAIKAEFININEMPKSIPPSLVKVIGIMNFTLIKLFGSNFFKKGE